MLRRQLRLAAVETFFAQLPPCVVGMEACGSAHHWARVIGSYGHEVKLMPPAYVKPYVKRNKNDGRDAEGICEAVGRPTMRFVPVKSVAQQATLAVHGVRALLVRQRTMAANGLRAALSELGIGCLAAAVLPPGQALAIADDDFRAERHGPRHLLLEHGSHVLTYPFSSVAAPSRSRRPVYPPNRAEGTASREQTS